MGVEFELIHRSAGERSIAWSRDFSMEHVMRIKRVTRSTLNDVLLTAISGALRSYMQKQGISNPPDIKVNLTKPNVFISYRLPTVPTD